jgi:uncharacterized FlaG/YvyC family protein
MIDPVRPTYGPVPTSPARETQRARPKPVAETAVAAEIPTTPPAEVLENLNRAAEVLQELASKRLELRFAIGKDKHVEVEVRDADGQVVRRIPATSALEMLSGGSGPSLLFDSLG